MARWKKVLSGLLMSFVLISIGFALGRESARRSMPPEPGHGSAGAARQVLVYYMHSTIRCATCNRIEKMAAEVIDARFAEARRAGRLTWREADYQQQEALAARYGVVASCVVVVELRDGEEVAYNRLDDVWTLVDKPEAFADYVGNAVQAYLDEEAGS